MSDAVGGDHELGEILDQAPCGFLRFKDDGTVVRANSTLLTMLGSTADEIEGNAISTVLATAANVFFQTHFFPSLRLHGIVKEFYLSLRNKSGASIPVLVNAVRRKSAEEVFNDCIIVEMVERERFEDALLRAKKEAEESKRLKESALVELEGAMESLARAKEEVDAASRSKDDFLAALSHELRTPLTPVLLLASVLEEDTRLPTEIRDQVRMIRRNVELETTLIDDLLDVTRIRHGKLTLNRAPVDLHAILERTKEIVLRGCEEKKISLLVAEAASRHFLNGDSARIQQVIWNLINNAVKFTPEGGTVTVSTENDGDDRILVKVRDTGMGIHAEHLPLIFNRFEQGVVAGQHRFGGLGLGLSICQAIVIAHEGEIRAESDGEGKGATFSFYLDTIDEPDQPDLPESSGSTKTESMNILLVEDHDTSRLVISSRLSAMDHQVTGVGTLAEAEEAFQSNSYDLVISDLGLPDGSGLDLMKSIRLSSNVPSIALSGFGMPEDIRQMEEAGFSAQLVKPIKMEALLSAIQEACVAAT